MQVTTFAGLAAIVSGATAGIIPRTNAAFSFMQAHQLVFHPFSIAQVRIDPIVTHGINIPSGHLHSLIGPDVINSNSTSDQLRKGTCTSLTLGNNLDMSAYWQPTIHHVNSKGEFTLLNLTSTSVYYNMAHTKSKMVAFPDEFSMITGNATAIPGGKGPLNGYVTACDQDLKSFPRKYCSRVGYHAQFPDCHDGVTFDKATQNLHMIFSNPNTGDCPAGYIKYPAIMLEFMYEGGSELDYPGNPTDQPTYVFGNGDADGSTGHADFMNGWKTGVLQQVIDQCSNLGFGNTAKCPVFSAHMGKDVDAAASACKYSQKIPGEDIGAVSPAKKLPGCNPIKGITAPAKDRRLVDAGKLSDRAVPCPSVSFVKPREFLTWKRSGGWPIA